MLHHCELIAWLKDSVESTDQGLVFFWEPVHLRSWYDLLPSSTVTSSALIIIDWLILFYTTTSGVDSLSCLRLFAVIKSLSNKTKTRRKWWTWKSQVSLVLKKLCQSSVISSTMASDRYFASFFRNPVHHHPQAFSNMEGPDSLRWHTLTEWQAWKESDYCRFSIASQKGTPCYRFCRPQLINGPHASIHHFKQRNDASHRPTETFSLFMYFDSCVSMTASSSWHSIMSCLLKLKYYWLHEFI